MIKQAKKFTYIVFGVLVVFVLFNYLTWHFYTENLISPPEGYVSGDLARLSYFKQANELKLSQVNLPEKHIDLKDYNGEQIDILTIGDSFLNGTAGIQDYIASYKHLNILNIKPYKHNDVLETLIIIMNNGLLGKINPKILLLENAERSAGIILSKDMDLSKNINLNEFMEFYKKDNKIKNKNGFFQFITDANIRCYLFDLLYLFSDKPFISQVYIAKTTKQLFSKFENNCLIIDSDIAYLKYNSPENIIKINTNLNKITDSLAKKNIEFYFMPATDKYDLYYEFLINNNKPKPIFFDEIRKLPKKYHFIDTEFLLKKELAKGTKDIFYKDDTHWSDIATKAILDNIDFDYIK